MSRVRPSRARASQNSSKKSNGIAPKDDFEWQRVGGTVPAAFKDEQTERRVASFITRLQEHVDAAFHNKVNEEIRSVVHQVPALLDQTQLHRMRDYLDEHYCVIRLDEQWAPSTLPGGSKSFGYKIGIKKRRAPDDDLYIKNPTLQAILPRGLVFTEVPRAAADDDDDEYRTRLELALFANRKFFGKNAGDDDDTDICASSVREQNFSSFVVSIKANGESCQLALLGDGKTWLIGSKNRKVAARSTKDLDFYKENGSAETMYSYALEMAEAFFAHLARIGDAKTRLLRDFLLLTRLTLTFEFESPSHQHIVPLYETRMVNIGATGIHVRGTCVHPLVAKAIANLFEFPSVIENDKVHRRDELDEQCMVIHKQWELEGAVMVLLNDSMDAIDLIKVKTWWYICLRAIREKLANMKSASGLARTASLIESRLKVLRKSIGIDAALVDRFIRLGQLFAAYVAQDGINRDLFRERYPLIWRKFLDSKGLPHDRSLLSDAELPAWSAFDNVKLPLLVLLQGVPGVGKSLMAEHLCKVLNEKYHIKSDHLAQDDFAHLGKKARNACLSHCESLLRDNQVVVLARNNANSSQYRPFIELDYQGQCKTLVVTPRELSTQPYRLLLMCMASVLHRKRSDADHPTDSMHEAALATLPIRFYREFDRHPAAVEVEYVRSPSQVGKVAGADVARRIDEVCGSDAFRQRCESGAVAGTDELAAYGLATAVECRAVMSALHRPLSDVVDDVVRMVLNACDADVPPAGSYVGIVLSSADKEAVLALALGVQKKSWATFGDHVTLMHSNQFWTHKKEWTAAVALVGAEVDIVPYALLSDAEKGVVLSCDIVSVESGESLRQHVHSGAPHITIATAPGVKAYQSAELLKAAGLALPTAETSVSVSAPMDADGHVQLDALVEAAEDQSNVMEQDRDEWIRTAAYYISMQSGDTFKSPHECWLEAERDYEMLRHKHRGQSSADATRRRLSKNASTRTATVKAVTESRVEGVPVMRAYVQLVTRD